MLPYDRIHPVIEMYFKRIAQLRKDRGIMQKEIAATLYLSPGTYGRYERGDREPPVWVIQTLADYYNTTMDYILGRTDDPSPPRA